MASVSILKSIYGRNNMSYTKYFPKKTEEEEIFCTSFCEASITKPDKQIKRKHRPMSIITTAETFLSKTLANQIQQYIRINYHDQVLMIP